MNSLQQIDLASITDRAFASSGLVSMMGDLAFLLSPEGVIIQTSTNDYALAALVSDDWNGQTLISLVTQETTDAAATLLATGKAALACGSEEVTWEDIAIVLPDHNSLPLRLGLMAQSDGNTLIAIAKDMRIMASLRQQLLNAQLTVEQDYWRLRMVETRYRSLFQMVSDGLIVVDDDTGKVLESNAAANKLLAGEGNKLVGKPFPAGFDQSTTEKIKAFVEETRIAGRGELANIQTLDTKHHLSLSASMLRQAEEARLLVRVFLISDSNSASSHGAETSLDGYLMDAPDAAVLTDIDGRVVAGNAAFVALTELRSVDQAIGRNLGIWIGKTSVETSVLITNLKRHRVVKLFATQIHGEFDSVSEVEISANQTMINGVHYFLLLIRDVSRRLSTQSPDEPKLPSSVAQITDQIGRVPLKNLVKQSTSIIEKLCIESALKITDNNRASAAELLGLSRQSLYAKLRLYELDDSIERSG